MNNSQKTRYLEELERVKTNLKSYNGTNNTVLYSQCIKDKIVGVPEFKEFVEEKVGLFCDVFLDGFFRDDLLFCKLFYDDRNDFSIVVYIENSLYIFVIDPGEIPTLFG